jgi:WhiB family redox-sensing transcriptional regulator
VTRVTSGNLPAVRAEILHLAARRLDITWQEAAGCRQTDPELFFPIGSAGTAAAEIQRAKAICAGCPVRRPCLTYALATSQEFGIWGGRDEDERRLLHRRWRESGVAEHRTPTVLNPDQRSIQNQDRHVPPLHAISTSVANSRSSWRGLRLPLMEA